MFNFPSTASGLLVGGSSMANFIGVLVARTYALGSDCRQLGLLKSPQLVAYASAAVHGCVEKAMEMSGLGSSFLRKVPVTKEYLLDIVALEKLVAQDIDSGLNPFLVVATAGTVNTGSIDPLNAIADFCAAKNLWMHVDGAFGASAYLSSDLRSLLKGLERADSLAFDFHKWLHVPYDAGCIIVRKSNLHLQTFASEAAYLQRATKGIAAGSPWFCDFGPDLSRGFRALKIWFTLKHYGIEALSQSILYNCHLAKYLSDLLAKIEHFQLISPATLNIVCFRFYNSALSEAQLSDINGKIVEELHVSGIAAPSTTTINGMLVIRVNITNHRTDKETIDLLVDGVSKLGWQLLKSSRPMIHDESVSSTLDREAHFSDVSSDPLG